MPTWPRQCDRCGAPGFVNFGEGGFGWYESFACATCGNRWEADASAPMPAEYRQAILDTEGTWTLELFEQPTPTQLVAIRNAIGLSLAETAAIKNSVPITIHTGTRAEVNSLAKRLTARIERQAMQIRKLVK